jgi:IclR family KDG regulon transcriptional repressor
MAPSAPQQRTKPKNMVQSIERAFLILDALSQQPQGLSLGDLSGKIGLSKGTTHRLVSSISYFDYARQDPSSKKYHLGFKLVELGNLLLRQLDLRNAAKPYLIDLAASVAETVHLVVRDYDEALYIDKVDLHSKQAGLQMVSSLGSRIPMHCSSVGKVILAHLSDDEISGIVASQGLSERTANTITDLAELKKHLEIVRRKGYAVDDEENEKGIRCVAAPILNESGKIVAAVSISGPTVRLTMNQIQNTLSGKVRETGMKISRELGFNNK